MTIGPNPRGKRFAYLAAALLSTSICGANLAAAADYRDGGAGRLHHNRAHRSASVTERHVVIERRALPQVALGGTTVLRGSRSPGSNIGQPVPSPIPVVPGEGYGSTNAPAPLPLGAGTDRGLDATGFDRSGLDPENPH